MNANNNNKLIAEFLGQKEEIIELPQFGYMTASGNWKDEFKISEFKFHKDWNWLMELVKQVQSACEEPEEIDSLKEALWWSEKEQVYNECVDFIKEFNKQKK